MEETERQTDRQTDRHTDSQVERGFLEEIIHVHAVNYFRVVREKKNLDLYFFLFFSFFLLFLPVCIRGR